MYFQVVGEYSHLQECVDQREVIRLLMKLLEQKSVSSETRVWILSALTKISDGQTDVILELAESISCSQDTVLRQQAHELRHLSLDSQLHEWVLARGAAWDDVEVPFTPIILFLIKDVFTLNTQINILHLHLVAFKMRK